MYKIQICKYYPNMTTLSPIKLEHISMFYLTRDCYHNAQLVVFPRSVRNMNMLKQSYSNITIHPLHIYIYMYIVIETSTI